MISISAKDLRVAQNKLIKDFNKPLELLQALKLPEEDLKTIETLVNKQFNASLAEMIESFRNGTFVAPAQKIGVTANTTATQQPQLKLDPAASNGEPAAIVDPFGQLDAPDPKEPEAAAQQIVDAEKAAGATDEDVF